MTEIAAPPRVMLNYAQADTREVLVSEAFPMGVPADDPTLLHQLEETFHLPVGSLAKFAVRREANGNILCRPQATFGN